MTIYCGNNKLNDTGKPMGTRYTCFKRGVGVGLHLACDPSMTKPFEPIFQDKIYCGNSKNLPAGYDRMGTLVNCAQKGVGVGKKIRAEKECRLSFPVAGKTGVTVRGKWVIPTFFVLISIISGLSLYFKPPTFLLDSEVPIKHLDKMKFILFFSGIEAVLFLICLVVYLRLYK